METAKSTVERLTAEAARLYNANDIPAAAAIAEQILTIDANHLIAIRIVGVAKRKAGEFDASIQHLKRGIELYPQNAILWFELGANYIELHNHREAFDCLSRCIQLAPNFQPAYVNMGGLLEQQERYEDAMYYARRARELNPTCPMANYNLSNALRETGNLDEAIVVGKRAVELDPTYAKARWNLGICHLLLGNYEEGWPRYEGREESGEVFLDRYTEPRWDGSSLSGKTIVVHGEQGIGDEILFASCLPELIPQAEKVILICDPRLKHLFARSFPTTKVYGFARMKDWSPAPIPDPFDVQIAAGSLPMYLRPTAASFPRRRQFLVPDPTARARWRERYAALGRGLKVGISWRAGGKAAERRKRSIELDQWESILTVPGAHFINLQYSDSTQDFAAAADKFGVAIHDWEDGDPLVEMDGYAARIAELDLVISVGNATVHMAGAVGTPAWAMLPMIPSWRWMVHGDESPWYQKVRLFRQTRRGQWQPVLDRIGEMLCELAGEPKRVPFFSAETTPSDVQVINVGHPHEWLDVSEMNRPIDAERLGQMVDEGNTLLAADNFEAAEQLFRDVLQIAPRHVRALHGLGTLALRTARPELAIRSFQRAIAMLDLFPEHHCDLAFALQQVGRDDEAVESYRRALAKSPDLERAKSELAALLNRLGRPAAKLVAPAAPRRIDDPALVCLEQGRVHRANCRLDEAIASFRRAIELRPALAAARNALAECLLEDQAYDEAEAELHEAIRLEPTSPEHYVLLGRVLRKAERSLEAVQMLSEAHRLNSLSVPSLLELAQVERELGQLGKAIDHFQEALANQPDNAEAHNLLGVALQESGELQAALNRYSAAVDLAPAFSSARFNRALALLQCGQYEEGWREYEWRWKCPAGARPRNFFPWPTWSGESLTGKTILIHAEQGIGDEIMFASCYREVIAQADHVVMLCEPRLRGLMQRSFADATVIGVVRGREHQWQAPPALHIDVQIAAGSLPLYLRRRRGDFPVRSHYLLAEPAAMQKWRSRFALLGEGLKVGIAWRAGSSIREMERRTIALSHWASLLSLPNVHFVNLQHGDCRQEIEVLAGQGATLHHWADADNRDDLDGLASRAAALDLVITAGNSLAHLAGALGVETWALVPRSFAWRWLTDEQRTPWYSSVKIYRQEQSDRWESLVARVHQDLLNQYTRPDEEKPMHGVPRPHWAGQTQGSLAPSRRRTR